MLNYKLKGAHVPTSELSVSTKDLVCLLLILSLFIFSVYACFGKWKKICRMPDGVSYYIENYSESLQGLWIRIFYNVLLF